MDSQRRTLITLVRHGASTYNNEKRMQGCSDASTLSAEGFEQARRIGSYCKQSCVETPVTQIFTSPLQRAAKTAQIIADSIDIPHEKIIEDADLREFDIPGWEGIRHSELETADAENYRLYRNAPQQLRLRHQGRTIYPFVALYQQARAAAARIARSATPHTLIVSHSGTLQALLANVLGLGPERHHTLQISNCTVSRIETYANSLHNARITLINLMIGGKRQLPKLKAGKTGERWLIFPLGSSSPVNLIDRLKQYCNTENLCAGHFLREQEPAGPWRKSVEEFFAETSGELTGIDQTALRERYAARFTAEPLTTRCLFAGVEQCRDAIRILGELSAASVANISIHADTVTVLHRTANHPRPILQGLNLPL